MGCLSGYRARTSAIPGIQLLQLDQPGRGATNDWGWHCMRPTPRERNPTSVRTGGGHWKAPSLSTYQGESPSLCKDYKCTEEQSPGAEFISPGANTNTTTGRWESTPRGLYIQVYTGRVVSGRYQVYTGTGIHSYLELECLHSVIPVPALHISGYKSGQFI